jgi:DNA topoisomerase-1
LDPRGHSTSPPARYTEASLVKTLEELGIGRPSTYASILSTIQDRGYAWKKGSALLPTWLAFAVIKLLEDHFGRLVDYRFTSSVEDDLDEIAGGRRAGTDWLTRFYFGSDQGHEHGLARAGGLKKLVGERLTEIDAREVNSLSVAGLTGSEPPEDGGPFVRIGRYGPYVQLGDQRASLPEDLPPDELTMEKARELLDAPSDDRVLGTDPESGAEITLKNGRFGPYVQRGPDDDATRSSVFSSMDPTTVTLEDALRLLTLPRVLGTADGEEITAQNGRYGPFIRKGSDSRSLENEAQLFTITLDDALALLAQPKKRGRGAARAAAPPLRELGNDPASAKPMVVKEGRFGPYVTDGETNASLRKGDSVEEITAERGAELLAERRARGPAPAKKAVRRAPAKKTTAKKATTKSVAKKATKRTPTKRSGGDA